MKSLMGADVVLSVGGVNNKDTLAASFYNHKNEKITHLP